MDRVVTRIAPSPTGYMHVGTLRTAIYNYLFAKKMRGTFLLRIEDTDVKRNRPEYEADLIEEFRWSGIVPDETVRQSERLSAHRKALQSLIDADRAYVSNEPSKDDPSVRAEVVRLRSTNATVTFTDLIRGDISFDTTELGDFVIARSPESPLYHLAVVVDDADMHVSHVIRGEDHISNTPRQILIQEALGLPRPQYAHIPLNLAKDRSKLSKREGDVSVRAFREQGYLSEALVNYLAVIGWTPESEKELLTLEEMIREFDLRGIHKSASVFDTDKLRWYNRQYLLRAPREELEARALDILRTELASRNVPYDERRARALMPLLLERISVWEDARIITRAGELDYFFTLPRLGAADLPGKGSDAAVAKKHLAAVLEMLERYSELSFASAESVKSALWDYATNEGRAAVLWPLRYALSGQKRSPDPFVIASILGKEQTLERIRSAILLL